MLGAALALACLAAVWGWFRPQVGFYLLLALLPLTRELGAGPVLTRLTAFDLALAALVAGWWWREWRAGGFSAILRPLVWLWPVLAFVFLGLLRVPLLPHPTAALIEAGVYAEVAILAALTGVRSRAEPAQVYRVLILTTAAVAAICVYEYVALAQHWPTLWPENFRIKGPFKNPNQTGSYLAMGVPLLLGALAAPATVRLPPWALVLALGMNVFAVVITFSRTSIVATVLGLALFYLLSARWPRPVETEATRRSTLRIWAPMLILAAVVALIAVLPGLRGVMEWKLHTALQSLGDVLSGGGDGSTGFMGGVWTAALRHWRAQLLLGVGLGQFPFLNVLGNPNGIGPEVHGAYLAILAEAGLVGAMLLAGFLLRLGGRIRVAFQEGAGPLRPLLLGVATGLMVMMATGVWQSFLRKRHFWLLVGLAAAMAAEYLQGRWRLQWRSHRGAHGVRVVAVPDLAAALQLVGRSRLAVENPYLSPAWLRHWYHWYGQDGLVDFLLVYQRNTLIGYGAFGYRLAWGRRWYRFLGHGKSNYLEPVARAGREAQVAAALVEYFRALSTPAVVQCHDLNSESPAAQALIVALRGDGGGATAASGDRVRRYPLYPCPQMRMDLPWDAIMARLSTKRRAALRRSERQLAALGRPEFRLWCHPDEAPQLLALLPELQAVHRLRFRGVINNTATDTFWRFLAAAIPDLLGRGLEFATLRVQDRLVCYYACLRWGDRYVGYITAIDPAFRSLGPGFLLHVRAAPMLMTRGVRLFDFSKGGGEFKEAWQDGASCNEAVVWWVRPGRLGRLAATVQHFGIRLRLWLRHTGFAHQVRLWPGQMAAIFTRQPRCVVATLPADAPLPVGLESGVLPAIRNLPVPVQDTIVRMLTAEPGAWQAAVDRDRDQVYLACPDKPPRCVSWTGGGG